MALTTTETKEKARAKRLWDNYKLTIAQYDAILVHQGGVCYACGQAEPVKGRRLSVDHDHATGLIRGLLCSRCNPVLGKIERAFVRYGLAKVAGLTIPTWIGRMFGYTSKPPASRALGGDHYGYKGHIGMDEETDVIHTVEFTTANVHDSEKFDDLLLGTEKRVYADKGYANKERRERLQRSGVQPKIMHKGYRNRPLTKRHREQNKIFAKTRNAVEKPFAYMKVVLNYTRCRYYDFHRNRFQFSLAAVVYNIRRFVTLTLCYNK